MNARFVVFAVLATALAACGRTAHLAGHASADYGPAPPFTLTNISTGRSEQVPESHRIIVLTFVAADCRDACPRTETVLRSAAWRLRAARELARRVRIVTVEIDPRTNSVHAVRRLRKRLWPMSGWSFLRGTPAKTSRILAAYGTTVLSRTASKDVRHSDWVYVIDGAGREVSLLSLGVNLTTANLLHAVESAGLDKAHQDFPQ